MSECASIYKLPRSLKGVPLGGRRASAEGLLVAAAVGSAPCASPGRLAATVTMPACLRSSKNTALLSLWCHLRWTLLLRAENEPLRLCLRRLLHQLKARAEAPGMQAADELPQFLFLHPLRVFDKQLLPRPATTAASTSRQHRCINPAHLLLSSRHQKMYELRHDTCLFPANNCR